MYQLRLSNSNFGNEDVLKSYVNVYIHCENNLIVEGHMVVLAQHSPFCHRFFQSRKGMLVADMFFTTIKHSIVETGLKIIYGKMVSVGKSDFKRVCSFLKMFQVEFEFVPLEDISDPVPGPSSEDQPLDRTFETSCANTALSRQESPQNVDNIEIHSTNQEQPFDLESVLDNWTVTTENGEKVSEIDHTMERLESLKRIQYKCKHCGATCLAFQNAENHFVTQHQDIQHVIELHSKVERERKSLNQEFQNLVLALKQNGNKTLVHHELT
jgi:hypothetical protein